MSAAATLDEIAGHDALAGGGGDGLREWEGLDELAGYGRDIARVIARRVQAGDADQPVAELQVAAMAYARVARAVRLTVMLKAKLAGTQAGAQIECRAGSQADAGTEADEAAHDPEQMRKFRVERIIERAAKARHPDDEPAVDRLMTEAGDRLDDDDLYGDVLERPMSEVLALICRDLGLELDWTRLAEEAWATQEIAGGQPGWPLAGLALAPARPLLGAGAGVMFRRDTG
ncbi:MAG TPA: hypothetical protein VGM25_07310 [Caulobacteraceae bacterium]|jgi:hypothetical protein